MTYTDAINDLFRYNAPADSVHSIVQQAEAGGPVHHTNIGDGVLADYLADHDDPRSEIVRRHLKRTENADPSLSNDQLVVRDIEGQLGGIANRWEPEYHQANLDKGNVFVHTYSSARGDGRRSSIVTWDHPLEGRNYRRYRAVFSPEEAAHIMSCLKPVSEGLPVPID